MARQMAQVPNQTQHCLSEGEATPECLCWQMNSKTQTALWDSSELTSRVLTWDQLQAPMLTPNRLQALMPKSNRLQALMPTPNRLQALMPKPNRLQALMPKPNLRPQHLPGML